MAERAKSAYTSEADLCADFVKHLPETWKAFPETCGWDILLVREADGVQVGVEAKLTLNAKVIEQAAESYDATRAGPDFRAVLVPHGVSGSFLGVCELIGITVIAMRSDDVLAHWMMRGRERFSPQLPTIGKDDYYWNEKWFDRCPHERHELPEYVPDVSAGKSAPVQLTAWKVRAIKIAVTLEKRGYVCRSDFKHFQIDPGRWIQPGFRWLEPGPVRGTWVKGNYMPNFRAQHPVNFEQIAADFDKWKSPEPQIQLSLDDLNKDPQ